MKVALCEDNQHERDYTKYMIYRFRPNWHIIEYKSGEDLIDAYENGKFYDIIFLDIYMDQLNGMDTAKLLRTKGINTAIVFLTSSADFAIESYEVRALSYLLKPITFEKLQELLEILEHEYRPKQIYLGNNTFSISDILYIESRNKKVIIHTCNGYHKEWTAKLSDIEDSIPYQNFLRCHQSYIINMDAVNRIVSQTFLLSNGCAIPMRRQNATELKQKYFRYITS